MYLQCDLMMDVDASITKAVTVIDQLIGP